MLPRRLLGSSNVGRCYKNAVERLNSLQTGFDVLEENRRTGRRSAKNGVVEMRKWLEIIGYSVNDLRQLEIIHVAGTKGKGSTCTYVASILKEYGISKIGLYTSPHLKHVRERIQIDGEPISEEVFAKAFFRIWDKIAPGDKLDRSNRPGYFRCLTLMSFCVYLEEGVNVAVYETGVGGEYDSTNVIEEPVVTGITGLAIDHEKKLHVPQDKRPLYFRFSEGDQSKKEQIAWHKSGILKVGRPAFSVPQGSEAEHILRLRAVEKGVTLNFVDDRLDLPHVEFSSDVNKENATLAVYLANTLLCKHAKTPAVHNNKVSEEALRGLKKARLPGRCQSIKEGLIKWYLDVAHTEESLHVVGQWFSRVASNPSLPRLLIFNHESQRDGDALLKRLFHSLHDRNISIQHAVFCTDRLRKEGTERADFVNRNSNPVRSLHVQERYGELWHSLDKTSDITIMSTVEEAVSLVGDIGKQGMQILITGSFYLVGASSCLLEPDV